MDSGANQKLQNLQDAPVSSISPVENEPGLKQKLISIIQEIKEREILTQDYIIEEGFFGVDQEKSLKFEHRQTIQKLDEIITLLGELQSRDEKNAEKTGRALGFLWSRFPNIFKDWSSSSDKEQEKQLDEISTRSDDPETKKQVSILKAAMISAGATFVLHQAADAYFNRPSNTKGVQYHMQITRATGVASGTTSSASHVHAEDEKEDSAKAATSVGILGGIFSGLGWPSFLTWSRFNKLPTDAQTEELTGLNAQVKKLPTEQQAAAETPMRNLIRYTLAIAGPAGATVGLLELARKYGVPQPWEAAAGLVSSAQSRAGAGAGRKCYKCGCKKPASSSARVMAGTAKAGSSWGQWAQDATYSFSLSKAWDNGNFFKNLVGDNMTGSALLVASTAQAATVFGELREKAQALADVRKGLGKGPTSSKGDWDKEVSAYRAGVGNIVEKLVQYDQLTEIQGRELRADLQAVPRLPYDTAEDIEKSQAKIDDLVATIEKKIPHFDVNAAEGASGYGAIPIKIIRQVKKSEGIKTVQARLLGTMLLIALSGFGYALYRMYYSNEQRTLRRLKARMKAAYEEYKKKYEIDIDEYDDEPLGSQFKYITELEEVLVDTSNSKEIKFYEDDNIRKKLLGQNFTVVADSVITDAVEFLVDKAQKNYINFLTQKLGKVRESASSSPPPPGARG